MKTRLENITYLLWNSGDPSVRAAICRGSVAFAIVADVAGETGPASETAGAAAVAIPRIRPPTSCSAKFILFKSAPVFTHASARSA